MSEPNQSLSLESAQTHSTKGLAEELFAEPVGEAELDLIKQELALRKEQMRLREQELGNAHEYSIKAMDASFADRTHERSHSQEQLNTTLRYTLFLFINLVALICYALYLTKDQFVMELVKALIFLLTGGIGGYSLQKLLPKRDDANKDSLAKKDDA